MTAKPWKIILLLVGIFGAGCVAGGFIAVNLAQKAFQRRGLPEQWGPARLKILSERLSLTPEQVERLKPIVRRDMEDLTRLRQQGFAESRRILERLERDIGAVLTPEQKAKFEQFNREQRQRRMQEFRRGERGERRERPPGAPEGPPGPRPGPPPEGRGPGG
jgi:Spy/CpxP family protein refolding chaperone